MNVRTLTTTRRRGDSFLVLEPVYKMGSAGDSPAPVGDPPNGTTAAIGAKGALALASDALPIPSGESPDGTGWQPVPPMTDFFRQALSSANIEAKVRPRGAPFCGSLWRHPK